MRIEAHFFVYIRLSKCRSHLCLCRELNCHHVNNRQHFIRATLILNPNDSYKMVHNCALLHHEQSSCDGQKEKNKYNYCSDRPWAQNYINLNYIDVILLLDWTIHFWSDSLLIQFGTLLNQITWQHSVAVCRKQICVLSNWTFNET